MDYASWLQALTTILNVNDTFGVAAFNALVPRFIEWAELRLYRDADLDFLATRISDHSQTTKPAVRSVAIPSKFIVIEQVTLITPANVAPADGTRVPLLRASRPYCDLIWPTESKTKAPAPFETYWCLPSMYEAAGSGATADEKVALPSSILIAPTVDGEYLVEYFGTYRPPSLSKDNSTTFLTQYLPDLFLAASVVVAAGYQRDFGADGNQQDPSLASYWEREYQAAKMGAAVEEARRAARSVGWGPYAPSTMANISRTQNPAPPAQGG